MVAKIQYHIDHSILKQLHSSPISFRTEIMFHVNKAICKNLINTMFSILVILPAWCRLGCRHFRYYPDLQASICTAPHFPLTLLSSGQREQAHILA